ncbi:MAG: signal peptidase I [Bifidobacteriaceae bacterium]|nr:signal peptidase I [Bifidobacteriaceae bacterium]
MPGSHRQPKDSFWRGFASVLGTVALLVLLALAVAVAGVPAVMQGSALTVLTGSMKPTLKEGDLVVVKGTTEQDTFRTGDIITFLPNPDDPTLITHRVVAVRYSPTEGTTYITRGDANGADDKPIMPKQIRGKYLYKIPKLGYLTNYLRGEKRSAVVFLAIGLILYGLFHIIFGKRTAPPQTAANTDPPVSRAARRASLANPVQTSRQADFQTADVLAAQLTQVTAQTGSEPVSFTEHLLEPGSASTAGAAPAGSASPTPLSRVAPHQTRSVAAAILAGQDIATVRPSSGRSFGDFMTPTVPAASAENQPNQAEAEPPDSAATAATQPPTSGAIPLVTPEATGPATAPIATTRPPLTRAEAGTRRRGSTPRRRH